MTNKQIEQKKQLLAERTKELPEDDLDKANGGYGFAPFSEKEKEWLTKLGEDAKKFDELAARILQ